MNPQLGTTVQENRSGQGEWILVVDDEEQVLRVLSQILTEAGYQVLTTTEGREALSIYKDRMEDIRLVVLDLLMPHMSGHSLLQSLNRLNPGLRILIVSGTSLEGEIRHALEAGALAAVCKPFSPEEILQNVRRLLDS